MVGDLKVVRAGAARVRDRVEDGDQRGALLAYRSSVVVWDMRIPVPVFDRRAYVAPPPNGPSGGPPRSPWWADEDRELMARAAG